MVIAGNEGGRHSVPLTAARSAASPDQGPVQPALGNRGKDPSPLASDSYFNMEPTTSTSRPGHLDMSRRDGHTAIRARALPAGAIAGATIGTIAALVIIVLCVLPFILKARRKRSLRQRHDAALRCEMGMAGQPPTSESFPPQGVDFGRRHSRDRLTSTAGTSSDHDSQTGKDYGVNVSSFQNAPILSVRTAAGQPLPPCSPESPTGDVVPAPAPVPNGPSAESSPKPSDSPVPWTETSQGQADLRRTTFGAMTLEPEPLSRSATGSIGEPHSPSMGLTLRKFSSKATAVFHRPSTRSSGSESRGTGTRSPDADVDLDGLDHAQTAPSASYALVDDKPPEGGAAMEYYSGAPMSPPMEEAFASMAAQYRPGAPATFHLMAMPAASVANAYFHHSQQHSTSPNQLGSPFNPPSMPPTPASAVIKEEEVSDDGEPAPFDGKNHSLSPQMNMRLASMNVESPEKKFEPPPSPIHPAPGTVNPMDIMKPSTAAERSNWVDTELWKIENSPPPQIESSPPSQTPDFTSSEAQPEPSPHPQAPPFAAVVRHPTQPEVTGGNDFTQTDHHYPHYPSASELSSPPADQYAYGPSPSNPNSPETRLTEPESNYTDSPSPRSWTSNNATTTYAVPDYPAGAVGPTPGPTPGTTPGDSTSSKSTVFPCEQCDRTFDQVHKLNHHKRYHERPHECPHCDKRFGTKTHLDRHINDKHNKTRKYHCIIEGCPYSRTGGKSFPRKDNWRRHMQNKHLMKDPPEPMEEDATMTGA